MEWTAATIRRFRAVGLCLPQDKFAAALGFTKRTIGNAERGAHPPSLALRRALDHALEKATAVQRDRFLAAEQKVAASDVGTSPRNDGTNFSYPLTELASLLLAHVAATSAGTIDLPPDQEAHAHQLADYLRTWATNVNRRELLCLLPGTAGGYPFTARTVSKEKTDLDIDPVEHFQQMKNVLMNNDNIFGANSAILSVQEQINNIQQLRQGHRGADQQKLLHIQTQFADLCGWLYQDCGDYYAATYWSGRALEWSHICDDHDAIAFILARRSQLAGDMGDPAEALDAAEAALGVAPQKVCRIAAVAMTYAAHGHALRGEKADCERSYAVAQDLVGRLETTPASPWALFFDDSYIEMQRARSLTFLGDYGTAVDSFQRAISGLPRGYRRDRGVYLAREAVAHIGHGDVEQASTVGLQALTIGAETGSARIIAELKHVDVALRKFPSTSSAVDFRDAMNATFSPWMLAGHTAERKGD